MSVKYEGIIPPIVTPFTASGEIDEEKTANIILDDFRSGKLGEITLERL